MQVEVKSIPKCSFFGSKFTNDYTITPLYHFVQYQTNNCNSGATQQIIIDDICTHPMQLPKPRFPNKAIANAIKKDVALCSKCKSGDSCGILSRYPTWRTH
eukprot:472422-Amphidinium_carterae.1